MRRAVPMTAPRIRATRGKTTFRVPNAFAAADDQGDQAHDLEDAVRIRSGSRARDHAGDRSGQDGVPLTIVPIAPHGADGNCRLGRDPGIVDGWQRSRLASGNRDGARTGSTTSRSSQPPDA